MTNNEIVNKGNFQINEKFLAFGLIGLYLIFSIIWHFLTNAPWDDDCITRYFNTKGAINNPSYFTNLWNRPLFTILFFLPFQVSSHTILLMALISSVNAYVLYLAAKELKISNAYLVIPLLLFQAFFFTISRSALAEPLAATIISLGYLFYLRKKFFYFALIGSLLPLARLELSAFLIIWGVVLFQNKQWKYIPLMGISVLIWSLAGTYFDGDAFWIYEQTIGKENTENRYGHTGFWHYFQRYIYVIGPIVFYFFFIGFSEQHRKYKQHFFVLSQFTLGFSLYVLFSWKLNLGQAAGFLRHLASLSPFIALIGLYGYNFWIESIINFKAKITNSNIGKEKEPIVEVNSLTERIKEIEEKAKKKNLKPREVRYLINKAKKEFEQIPSEEVEEKPKPEKPKEQINTSRYRIVAYSAIMIILAYLFFSKELLIHHNISDTSDYTNIIILTALLLLYPILIAWANKKQVSNLLKLSSSALLICATMGYTLITEPPNAHNTPEREAMTRLSDLYQRSYFKNHNCYINHSWFFWANDIDRNDERFKALTIENLEQAPDSSLVIWENHYGNRLSGDVPLDYFKSRPEYVELIRERPSERRFILIVYQKIKKASVKDHLKIYERFIALDPTVPSIYTNRARIHSDRMGNYDLAIKDYDKALSLDSSMRDAHYNKGLMLLNLGQNKKALPHLIKTSELAPLYFNAHYYEGIAYYNLNDFVKAIEKFSKVIEFKPDHELAHYYRAVSHTKFGKFDEALADFTKTIQINPDNGDAFYNKAVILFKYGKQEIACADLIKALKRGSPDALPALQQYCGHITLNAAN